MNDRDRQILTDAFNALHHEISRKDVEADYIRLIIRELDQASLKAMLNLQLIEMNQS